VLSKERIAELKIYFTRCVQSRSLSTVVHLAECGLELIEMVEALQQENERLADETIKLMKENAKNSNKKDELVKVLKKAREAIQRAKENFEPYGEYEYDVRYDLEEALAEIDKAIGGKEDA
jgi:ElaB/YqjD/DUF883 family membrane-anchored ribosome-binding protein